MKKKKLKETANKTDMNKLYITQKKALPVSAILFLESDSNYTHIFMNDKKVFVASKTLNTIYNDLDKSTFYRINRSLVIHKDYIRNQEQQENSLYFTLNNGQKVKVARRRKKNIMMKMKD